MLIHQDGQSPGCGVFLHDPVTHPCPCLLFFKVGTTFPRACGEDGVITNSSSEFRKVFLQTRFTDKNENTKPTPGPIPSHPGL